MGSLDDVLRLGTNHVMEIRLYVDLSFCPGFKLPSFNLALDKQCGPFLLGYIWDNQTHTDSGIRAIVLLFQLVLWSSLLQAVRLVGKTLTQRQTNKFSSSKRLSDYLRCKHYCALQVRYHIISSYPDFIKVMTKHFFRVKT